MNSTFGRRLGLILVLIAALVLVIPASAQDATPETTTDTTWQNTITVSGSGTAYAAPDIAYIELGVETVDADLSTAFSQTGQTINNVVDALNGLGIASEDIQTSGINVYPQDQYDPQGGMTGNRVYRVSNTVRVTVRDVTQVEDVLTAAVEAGANTIYNLSFGIQDTATLEQDARTQAVENARSRAEQLASAVGVTLGTPVMITEVQPNDGFPIPYAGRGGGGVMDSSGQPVNQGQLSVSVLVEITYSIAAGS